jgi:cytochrome P450
MRMAGAMLALMEAPEQLAVLRIEPGLIGPTVKEVPRWTTPSPSKRRTATTNVDLGDRGVHTGDKVVVWGRARPIATHSNTQPDLSGPVE